MIQLTPELRTERLILRPPTEADFEPFAAMMADARHSRFIGGPVAPSIAWRGLMTMIGSWAARGWGMFCMTEIESGEWAGMLGPWRPHGWPGNEIGWTLAPGSAGKGLGLEGASAAMDWAFDHLDWSEVIHCINPGNTRSIGLAERLGSRKIGRVACPAPYDRTVSIAWGQTREEWRARRSEAQPQSTPRTAAA